MRVDMLLEMIGSTYPDRIGYTSGQDQLTYGELQEQVARGAAYARTRKYSAIVTVMESSILTPVTFLAAATAGIPYIPLNYRLSGAAIAHLLDQHPGALIVSDGISSHDHPDAQVMTSTTWRAIVHDGPVDDFGSEADANAIAALIYTSGTTSEPKASIARHAHLVNYVLGNIEFGDATPQDAALVCLPPYHIAGLMSLLSNLYLGRRVVFMPKFDAALWSATIETQGITHATVVPTMLAQLLAWVAVQPTRPTFASLKTLASGGAVLPVPAVRRILGLWPHVGLVNGYGLTETSSTIAVMDPESYRAALASADENIRARLGSVGRPVPGITVQIRRPDGSTANPGEHGEIFIRGDQVSGEYADRVANTASRGGVSNDGACGPWFASRDLGYVDTDGYLFVLGRADDTIIRGGENIAPAMIEEVLLRVPGITEAAVVGLPDEEWGQRLEAVVVTDGTHIDTEQMRQWCRQQLRSALTPERISIWQELPTNDSGKLMRREIVRRLLVAPDSPPASCKPASCQPLTPTPLPSVAST